MSNLADATVRVILEMDRFERELKARVAQAADSAGRQFDRDMRRQMSNSGRNAANDFRTANRSAMSRAGTSSARDFETSFRQGISKASSGVAQSFSRQLSVSVGRAGIEAGRNFCDHLSRVLTDCGRNAGNVLADGVRDALGRSLRGIEGNVERALTDGTTPAARSAGRNAARQFNLSFGIGSSRVGAPVLAAIAVVGSELVTRVAPALSIVAAFPPLLLAAAASAGLLATAFKGVGDAIKAAAGDSLEDLNAAMIKLSPTARGVVQEFRQMHPALQQLRLQVQNAFFGQLTGEMRAAALAMTGPLRQGILETSQSLGRLSRAFIKTFTEAGGVVDLEKLFRGTSGMLDQISVGVENMMRGFLDFAGAAAPGLNSVGVGLNSLLTRFGDFLTRSARSGEALVWIESGLEGLRQLTETFGDIIQVVMTLAAAARPLALVLSGVFELTAQLAQVFGELPGPIQTAALAAILFARSGLPEIIQRTTGESGRLTNAVRQLSEAYRTGADAGRRFGTTIQSGIGDAVDRTTDSATRMAATVRSSLVGAMGAVDTASTNVASSLRGGFVRATEAAASAAERAAASLYSGFNRASIQAQTALNRVTVETQATVRALRGGLIPTAAAIDSAVTQAGASLSRFASLLVGGVERGATAATRAVQQVSTAIQTNFIRAALTAQSAATSFGAAVQTTVIRAAQSANTALDRVGAALRNSVLRPLVNAQEAYRTTTTSLRAFAQANSDLTARLGQTPTVMGRIRDAFSNVTTVAAGTGSAMRAAFSGPISAMQNLGAAAVGLGNTIRVGLSSAVNGLMGVFGGPWGVALAAAGVALSIFASRQQEAAQKTAEYKAAVDSIQGTLNKVTGSITQYTKEQAASAPEVKKAIDAFSKYGISARTVVDAAVGIKGANDTVNASVQNTIRSLSEQKIAWLASKGGGDSFRQGLQELGLTQAEFVDALVRGGPALDDITKRTNALKSSDDNLSKSKGSALSQIINETTALRGGLSSYQEYAAKVKAAADAQRSQAEAAGLTVPGLAALSGAVDVLSDDFASAEQKAKALTTAMRILRGDSLSLEQAVAQARDLVDQMGESFKTGAEQARAHGQALIDDSGMINTNVEAGRSLLDQTTSYQEALASVIQQTYEKARAQGVSETDAAKLATDAGNKLVQSYREQAIAAGIMPEKIDALINRYGLVPSEVTTLIQQPGMAEGLLQLSNLKGSVERVPGEKKIIVDSNAVQNREQMESLGFKIRDLPDKKVEITANSKPAESALDSFLSRPASKVVEIVGRLLGPGAEGGFARPGSNVIAFDRGGLHTRSMPANRAEIVAPKTYRLIGDRARDDEAYIPITRSARSRAILGVTARRMGYMLVDSNQSSGPSRVVNIGTGAIVVNAPQANPEFVAEAAINRIARMIAL